MRLALTLLLAAAFGCTSKPTAPPKPALVPSNAVWAGGEDGGSFFECDADTKHNVNRCLVYNDYTGDVAGGGFFRVEGLARAARRDELRFRFFDGERIFLEGVTLVPVPPIPPETVPSNSVFANGLFISCGRLKAGMTDCSIFRPDGAVYFKGAFALDSALGDSSVNTVEYKFFDRSDRTIHLISGGALVAK